MKNEKIQNYENYIYNDEIKALFNVKLTKFDEKRLKKIHEELSKKPKKEPYFYIIKDLYILYNKNKVKTVELSQIYNINLRTIQKWLKDSGLRDYYIKDNKNTNKNNIKNKKDKIENNNINNNIIKTKVREDQNKNVKVNNILGIEIRDENEYPESIKGFINYYEVIKGKSLNTVNGYLSDIRLFLKFIKVYKGLDKSSEKIEDVVINDIDNRFFNNITINDMYAFLSYTEKTRDNGAYARSRKVAAIKALFKYLQQKAKIIEENPALELESPKKEKKNPIYLTLDQSKILLNSLDKNHKNYYMDYCILTLFLNCGMRISELCSIQIPRIKGDILTIVGKGNKERTVYLNNACLKALNNYLNVRDDSKATLEDKSYLFLSSHNKKISTRTVELMVKKHMLNAGLTDANYTPHKLRHTAATLMYKHGNVDIRSLQGILGHENISTTQIYTHVDDESLREAIQSNPLADL